MRWPRLIVAVLIGAVIGLLVIELAFKPREEKPRSGPVTPAAVGHQEVMLIRLADGTRCAVYGRYAISCDWSAAK